MVAKMRPIKDKNTAAIMVPDHLAISDAVSAIEGVSGSSSAGAPPPVPSATGITPSSTDTINESSCYTNG